MSALSATRDTWMITRRNLYRYLRLPQALFFSSVQPIMFLLLFNFVFGGAIHSIDVPGDKYINYLLPAILIQVVMFGGLQTSVGLAADMNGGMVDRFRSLPMSRLAVLAGRTLADAIRNVVVAAIMIGVGTLLGFRFQNGPAEAVLMILLVLAFGFAFSWVMAFIGMGARDPETAQIAGFPIIFPLIFASAAFVPIMTMPEWLQAFALNQPVTHAVQAARSLALGTPDDGAWWKLLLWIIGILIVFVPLSVMRYRKRA